METLAQFFSDLTASLTMPGQGINGGRQSNGFFSCLDQLRCGPSMKLIIVTARDCYCIVKLGFYESVLALSTQKNKTNSLNT